MTASRPTTVSIKIGPRAYAMLTENCDNKHVVNKQKIDEAK